MKTPTTISAIIDPLPLASWLAYAAAYPDAMTRVVKMALFLQEQGEAVQAEMYPRYERNRGEFCPSTVLECRYNCSCFVTAREAETARRCLPAVDAFRADLSRAVAAAACGTIALPGLPATDHRKAVTVPVRGKAPAKPCKTHAVKPCSICHSRYEMEGFTAEIIPGQSIRILGVRWSSEFGRIVTGRVIVVDRTFRLGDVVEEHSYNLVYTGVIHAITAKTIKVRHERGNGDSCKHMDLYAFVSRNWDLNLAAISKRNAEWSD